MGRRKRRAFAVALVTAVFGALLVAPVARGQDLIEYALFVALIQQLGLNDTTPPAITITTPPEGATYTQGQAVTADYACDDAGVDALTTLLGSTDPPHSLDDFLDTFREIGGVDLGHPACGGPVPSGGAVDTSTPGPHNFTVNARDIAVQFVDTNNDGVLDAVVSHPNTSTLTHHYSVAYPFGGFQRPVDNLNSVKAGQAVPIKFSLGGDRGLGILDGAPTSHPTGCPSAPNEPLLPASTAGNSTLQYDAASDTYTWVWKTDKAWARSCRTLTVALDDGTEHTALFTFK
jgi:hypothetical protein